MTNQLTGPPPVHYPAVQGSGEFSVIEIPETPPSSPPKSVPARCAHGAQDSLIIELLPETDVRQQPGFTPVDPAEFHDEPRKSRSKRRARGEDHGSSKLDEAKVMQIRALDGVVPVAKLAKALSVSRTAIYKVLSGETWTGTTDEGEHDEHQ